MYGVPIAEDTPARTSAINASGRLTTEQIQRVRTARAYATQAALTFVVPFALIGGSSIETIEKRLEALPGQLGETLSFGWFVVMLVGMTFFIVFILRTLRLQLRFSREVGKGEVAAVDGALRWRGRRYVAETADLRLHVPDSLAAAWYPGLYRFYYLPRSRVVAAAERLDAPLSHADWRWRHPVTGLASLPFNREGRRSPTQHGGDGGLSTWLMGVFAVLIVGDAIALFAVHAPNDLFVYLSQLIIAPLYVLFFANFQCFTDLRPGQVAVVEGEAQRERRQKNTGNWEFAIIVGGVRVKVSKPVYDALAEPYRYRVYYGARGGEFLNVEPIGELPAATDSAEA